MSCPLCGSYFPPGHGHACVARAPLPSNICENGCVRPCRCAPRPKKRTVCADCRHYRARGYDSLNYLPQAHVCQHENARNLITGEPTSCSRNLGNCPDYQEKQP